MRWSRCHGRYSEPPGQYPRGDDICLDCRELRGHHERTELIVDRYIWIISLACAVAVIGLFLAIEARATEPVKLEPGQAAVCDSDLARQGYFFLSTAEKYIERLHELDAKVSEYGGEKWFTCAVATFWAQPGASEPAGCMPEPGEASNGEGSGGASSPGGGATGDGDGHASGGSGDAGSGTSGGTDLPESGSGDGDTGGPDSEGDSEAGDDEIAEGDTEPLPAYCGVTLAYYSESSGADRGDAHYNPVADVDSNGTINFRDRILWKQVCPSERTVRSSRE